MEHNRKIKEAEKMLSDYAKYINSLDKPELVKLIIGTDGKPPLLTRDEPKYSRPQILWALNKLRNLTNKEISFDYTDQQVDALMNIIEGMKWDNFYNYDYIRFDVRKPFLYWVLIILLLSFTGGLYTIWKIINFLISIF